MSARRRRLMAAGLATVAVAAWGCGTSPEDTAHDDGKQVGEALAQLASAQNADQVRSAANQLSTAVGDVSDKVAESVRQQLGVQRSTIDQAITTVTQAATSPDQQAATQARDALQQQLQNLRSQAASFRDTGNSVTNSFWDGVKDGYDDG